MEDEVLIKQTLGGDRSALETLIKNHQTWIFNVSLHLTVDANDASDLTQEVLIKMVANLSKFKQESSLRTWLYRIIKNHFLNSLRAKKSRNFIDWEEYAAGLDTTPDEPLTEEDINHKLLVEEAKLSCMKGMLLCLTPEQRLVYVMGELFELTDSQASEILDISRGAYRKQLSRTRSQLYNFMNQKCGLVNHSNPCRCANKTKGFIKKGYVDPNNLQFQKDILSSIEEVAAQKLKTFENDAMTEYKRLYQSHYYLKPINESILLQKLMTSDAIKVSFDLN